MELTKKQIQRQDFVDNTIFQLLQEINPTERNIEWNIEIIAELRKSIKEVFVDSLSFCDEQTFYPFLKE